MPEIVTNQGDEMARLQERVRKLAMDKSYLQLIMNLMNKVSAAQSLDNMIETLLGNILDVIGGTNIILYYLIDDDIYYADLMSSKQRLEQIDDAVVKRVFESREPVEFEQEFGDTQIMTQEFTKAYTWIYPLMAGTELIGIIKLENLHIAMRELYGELPTLFTYVAAVLKNEIFSHTQIKLAYDQMAIMNEDLEMEIEERINTEEQLRAARNELEMRVAERTAALQTLNEQLQCELGERIRVEEALRASTEEIHDLYNHAPCGYHSLDADGTFILINDTELQWLGYSREEIVGKRKFTDLITAPSLQTFQDNFPVFKTQGWVKDQEFEMVRRDGTILPVLLNASAVYEDGNFLMSRSTIYDITERRKVEEQSQLLSAIVQSSDDAIIAKDLDGTILSWNSGAERIYGYGAEEAVGRSIAMLLPTEQPDELGGILSRIKLGERIEHYTTERIRKDGKQISISLTISPIRNREGKVVGASSIARDDTSRREAEDALRRSEARLREAQRIARIGSWELDLEKNSLLWSDEIFRIFEIDPARFSASYEGFLESIHPDDRDAVNAAYTASVSYRSPYSIEHRLLFPDGRVKYVHEQCETHYAADGKPLCSIGTVQDITERMQAEKAIRELYTDLEKRVGERTIELKESQQALMNIVEDLNEKTGELEQANARLQELERLKSMFIASMSHELRTPLNSIIGFSSILHDAWLGPVNAEQKENLAIILRSGKHLLSLINDVIDVSKIEAGKIESAVEEFDLYELIMEGVAYIARDIREKGLELKIEADHLTMNTDRQRLLQCLLNLLSNAMKFTEKGEVSIKAQAVSAPGGEAEASVVEISVTDSGIGIRAEDLPRMFGPFVRLVPPGQATIPGTGLGLYLTRKLTVEILRGDILLTSNLGKGSSFTIKIPARIP